MEQKNIAHNLSTSLVAGAAGSSSGLPGSGNHPDGGGAGSALLFLREEQMRLAQDLFFFAYRDLTASADVILEELGLGRAHHRALHFIGRRPGIAVSELLALLRITKQSLARVLGELVSRGYVQPTQGPRDRRQRLLSLTDAGRALERRLFERQRERMVAAYREAGGAAVEGFRRVMRGVMDEQTRSLLEPRDAAAPPALRRTVG
ncbi:MarR family transcriptional regulator [Lichenicola cladoniae]|uniref:MarR family transcriptional regulator n=2 Tax=Lichenicola cladoniae TaxID=1484109 RepID=A0A6M8HW34_9PROT|nr:MarR family transcriptional regulator [Acetobacteraceae bacterium]QKE92602.1 MarR family transcriptional regulator [Lichenicola cladoniae]